MAVKAVVFDIGGVLEVTPSTGMTGKWEHELGLDHGELAERLTEVTEAGAIGVISEEEVHVRIGEILGLDQARVTDFMADVWTEYLGTLNTELAAYFTGLRPRYKTAIISNSFVGARHREQARYGFEDITDLIIYSHEVGMSKPDPRIYELTCERLRVRPEEMIFLDDVPLFAEAAQRAGLQAILFTANAHAIAEIEARLRR